MSARLPLMARRGRRKLARCPADRALLKWRTLSTPDVSALSDDELGASVVMTSW